MEENKIKALEKVREEIAKIDNKKSNIYFFVLDTKGVPSGSLEYIYKLAMIAKNAGYNTGILYQLEKNDEFVGVEEWLGKNYAEFLITTYQRMRLRLPLLMLCSYLKFSLRL